MRRAPSEDSGSGHYAVERFRADYLNGLIALTLATLEPTIVLSRK
ncbi:hypothetical protein [Cohnella faecalis]|nr:hypothetical protein [Cohnella faecalis]